MNEDRIKKIIRQPIRSSILREPEEDALEYEDVVFQSMDGIQG